MSWLENSKRNLLPLSKERGIFKIALAEWTYTGVVIDLDAERSSCELCEHPDIKYQFEIKNKFTRSVLLVGSECIRKFEIAAVDEAGEVLQGKQSAKKVARDRRKIIADAQMRKIVLTLIKLAQVDTEFSIDSFISYLRERGAFTPNQLAFLLWRLKKQGISRDGCHFKVVIKRDREKDQLISMPDYKFVGVSRFLSPAQRDFCKRNRPKRSFFG